MRKHQIERNACAEPTEINLHLKYNKEQLKLSAYRRLSQNKTILFIHGLGCSKISFKTAWHHQRLKDYSLLAYDLPGFGHSPAPASFNYSMVEQAEVCARLIQQLPHSDLHIVAHSMGGAIALLLPDTILEQITSMTSIEGNLIADDCRLFSEKINALTFSEFTDSFWPNLKLNSKKFPVDALDLDHTTAEAIYHSAKSLFDCSQTDQLLQRHLALGQRSHYIYGQQHHTPGVLHQLPQSRSIAIANSGHFPMQENPGQLYRQLTKIIKKNYSEI